MTKQREDDGGVGVGVGVGGGGVGEAMTEQKDDDKAGNDNRAERR